MSALAWIDFDQSDRDRTRRILDLFRTEEARDELGLGSVRDALSDLLFPGTSTIQTRLRYMLFVPWLYRMAAARPAAGRSDHARALEIRLVEALVRGGETTGVIGSEARERLKRLPSDVYWAGLLTLGIRRWPGSRAEVLAAGDASGAWSPGLPDPPAGLLDTTGFRLAPDEADFLRDRIAIAARDSLLNELVRAGDRGMADAVWLHPLRATWSPRNLGIVGHAERFARSMHGAALLYNLMLAERAAGMQGAETGQWHDRADSYRVRLRDWQAEDPAQLVADWDLAGLWSLTTQTVHRAAPRTIAFVTAWSERVRQGAGRIADDPAARRLILQRETGLKGTKARLTNDAALVRWGGASGAGLLTLRWPVAQRHLADLADAG